jgi:hypothetical protein
MRRRTQKAKDEGDMRDRAAISSSVARQTARAGAPYPYARPLSREVRDAHVRLAFRSYLWMASSAGSQTRIACSSVW